MGYLPNSIRHRRGEHRSSGGAVLQFAEAQCAYEKSCRTDVQCTLLQLLKDCICPALVDTYKHLLCISLSDNPGMVIYYKLTIAFGWLHWYNIVGFQYVSTV